MSIITGHLLVDLFAVVATLLAGFYAYIIWIHQYWKTRKIELSPPKFPFGNLESPFKRTHSFGDINKGFYDELVKRDLKYGGVYFIAKPILIVRDLDLVKKILVKDFDHFIDRGIYYNEKGDPLSAHLFAVDSDKWRNLRTKLTPTFTSGKMKMMFDTLALCAPNMVEAINKNINEPLDIKDILSRFTTDVIGSCAFGLECNSFKENRAPFTEYGQKIFERTPMKQLRANFCATFPELARALNIRSTARDVEEFFMNIVKKTVDYREQNQMKRKDFLQLLIDLKHELSFGDIAAQSFLFFVAGFETSATTMTFTMYNLARNPEIQEKLRSEINAVLKKHDNKITYESVHEMKYLQQVIDESLRLFPPVPFVNRRCTKDYQLDENLVVENKTSIFMSVLGIHRDENIYPDPEVFDPERFNEENKKNLHPCAFLPFGEGPRNCIGLRFGLMQSKVGLVTLLRNYKFTVNSKTKEPLVFDPHSIILSVKGNIWLNAKKL